MFPVRGRRFAGRTDREVGIPRQQRPVRRVVFDILDGTRFAIDLTPYESNAGIKLFESHAPAGRRPPGRRPRDPADEPPATTGRGVEQDEVVHVLSWAFLRQRLRS